MFNFDKIHNKILNKKYNSVYEIIEDFPYKERDNLIVFKILKQMFTLDDEQSFTRNLKDDDYIKSVSTILRIMNYIGQYTKNLYLVPTLLLDKETKNPKLEVFISFEEKGTMKLRTVPGKYIIEYTYAEKGDGGGLVSSEGYVKITKYNENTKDALDLIFGFGNPNNDRL